MTLPRKEMVCDDCGLPISICNAKAMVRDAIERHGVAKVADGLRDLIPAYPLERGNAMTLPPVIYVAPTSVSNGEPVWTDGYWEVERMDDWFVTPYVPAAALAEAEARIKELEARLQDAPK